MLYPDDFRENYYINAPCGKCYLCRKSKANAWRIRLFEEVKSLPSFVDGPRVVRNVIFVCFTFDDEHLPRFENRETIAVYIRKWRDLWRKKYGKSPRYYAVTDKGSQFGRLHLHLLIFEPFNYKDDWPLSLEELEENNFMWRNGMAREPSYLESEAGITYVTGYITGGNLEEDAKKHGKPICKEALEYVPMVFVSNGLGRGANLSLNNTDIELDRDRNRYMYRIGNYTYSLPKYYRDKVVPYYDRWHTNLVYKSEVEDYILRNYGALKYSSSGFTYVLDDVVRMYNFVYSKFDDELNKYTNYILSSGKWK